MGQSPAGLPNGGQAPPFFFPDDTVVVVGTAPCVTDDLARVRAIRPNAWLLGVNHAGYILPVNFLFSYHNELLEIWRYGAQGHPSTHGSAERAHAPGQVDFLWPGIVTSGTSSLGAVLLAAECWHAREVICAGVPLNGGDGYHPAVAPEALERGFGVLPAESGSARSFRDHWPRHRERLRNVYSMSGYTRELLGEPPP